jgi:polyisoprenoid-binding protein YceI
MKRAIFWRISWGILFGALAVTVSAAPVTYNVDPAHTYPAFEADHQGGLSIWRGKVKRSSGTIVLDKETETGTVELTMDMSSIDFGHDGMNEHAMASDILDVEQFPTATYVGRLVDFEDGSPTAVEGTLTLHGVTNPLNLVINRFRCQPHFRNMREVCGADAAATFNRDDFGVDYDKDHGFLMGVNLLITIEAHIAE